MCSCVSAEPSARGCGRCEIRPAADTRSDSFSTPFRPPTSTARSPEFTSPARWRSKRRSMRDAGTRLPGGKRIDIVKERPAAASGGGPAGSGQLGDGLDRDEEARVDEPLDLDPAGRGQLALRVVLEAPVADLEERVHVGRVDALHDDLREARALGLERGGEVRVDGVELPGHVAGADELALRVDRDGRRDVHGAPDLDRL